MANRTGDRKNQTARKNSESHSPLDLLSEIRKRAEEIYRQRGDAPGSELDDWLTAEAEVKSRYSIAQ